MSTSISTSVAVGDVSSSTSLVSAASNLPDVSGSVLVPTQTTYGSIVASSEPSSLDHASGAIVSLTGPVYAGGYGLTRIDQPMADVRLGDFLGRDVLVRGLSGFANDDTIEIQFLPWQDWAFNAAVADKLTNYQYIRGDMVVTGKLMAPPLSSGLIAVTFVPVHSEVAAFPTVPVDYVLTPQHVLLDVSTSSNFQVTLPWVYNTNWGNLSGPYDDFYFQWSVTVTTLTGVRAGITDGCLATSLRIFCRPENLQMSGAHFQSGSVKSTSTSLVLSNPSTSTPRGAEDANPHEMGSFNAWRRGVNAKSRQMFGGTPSQVLTEVAGAAGAAAAFFPVIAPAAAAVSAITGAAGAIASWFGFTRHTKILEPVEAHVRSGQNVINCDGVDTSRVAALFSTNRLCSDPAISGAASSVDETSLAYISSRFTRIATLTFTVGDLTPQDKIIPITPCIGKYAAGFGKFYPTCAGHVASRFTHWRGDMEYLFYPVLTSTHRGALQFSWQPNSDDTPFPTDVTNLNLNVIADLAAARPMVVDVGYNSHFPMLKTRFLQVGENIDPENQDCINGFMRVRCIVPITGSVCGQVVQVHVFAAAKGNMEFMQPTDSMSFVREVTDRVHGFDVVTTPSFQSGLHDTSTLGADGQSVQRYTLVPLSGDYPLDKILSGERVKSVRALMEKPCLYTITSTGPVPDPPEFEPGYGRWVLPHTLQTNGYSIDYLAFFGQCFFSFAGSIRYKLQVYKKGRSLIGGSATDDYRIVPWISKRRSTLRDTSIPIAEINPIDSDAMYTAEYTVPFYSDSVYVRTTAPIPGNFANEDVLLWDKTDMSGADYMRVRARLWRSITEDARICFYLGPPVFELLTDPVVLTNLLDFRFTE